MPDSKNRETTGRGAGAANDLERGRERYARSAWADAYRLLARAGRSAPLEGDDLERLATAAYLLGRDDEYLEVLERAWQVHVDAGAATRAARCGFWLGLQLMFRGEAGRATAWLARARRLLEQAGRECVERGYLLIAAAEQERAAGDKGRAYQSAARAAEIGERYRDPDLTACARHVQGRILVAQGDVARGLALLDEAMLEVTSGALSPVMTGLVYCSVIACCQQVRAVTRAHEWTAALARWCRTQPDMLAFTGACLVHRAEILHLRGDWSGAVEEARRACERAAQAPGLRPPAAAHYQQAEVHRLRGDFGSAEAAYREASRLGYEPQPGLALLRLAQGRGEQAVASIRRVLNATTDGLARTHLLPAYIDIMLATGDVEAARLACDELQAAAGNDASPVSEALAAQARGALALAQNDAEAALVALRRAWQAWQEVEAPYAAARSRMLMGLACRMCGDEDGGRLELEAARATFERLGAAPDAARIDALLETADDGVALTARELQVLHLVAAGKTNKAIAAELRLSEKTIDRHVSNILTKLDVPSRAAATAYAYRHKLI